MSKEYETVIGLEVHVELATKTKIFCGCSTAFGGAPNTHSCPVCSGMPGSLPVLNKQVVEYAMAVGLAAHCEINRNCKFDRKNYFYPDNPQNYQISQLYEPICRNGWIEIEKKDGEKKKIRIHEIHMEEDAGKLVHDTWSDTSYVDFNRSGVPLIEIVSEPDMRDADEVIAYLEQLRMIAQYIGASDCKLQEGSMRADVNLSVREKGSETLGTRTETKNLSSFRAISHMIDGERARQIDLLESGQPVVQETRHWNEDKETSYAMRSKENAHDASILTGSKRLADLFEETVALGANPKKVSNWLMVETLRLVKEKSLDPQDIRFSARHLADLIQMAEDGTVNNQVAREVFEKIFTDDIDPVQYVKENGLASVNDAGALEEAVRRTLQNNPNVVQQYKEGKTKVVGFLVGQVMKEMKGKANPAKVNELTGKLIQEY